MAIDWEEDSRTDLLLLWFKVYKNEKVPSESEDMKRGLFLALDVII